ncbi:MAG: class I SAM-dependent methyltransferase [Chlorobi bacterium]|nr:class I SAM-dependent methyltransferase [Chlorobiota bacterium]
MNIKDTKYGTYTYNSPSILRRLIHRYRLKKSLNIINVKKSNRILDYGAGDGYLSMKLYEQGFKDVTCFEPMEQQFEQLKYMLSDIQDVKIVNDVNEIMNCRFEKAFCLEVLEHLPEKQLKDALKNIYTLLNEKGDLLISVPCETGINGFIKNSIKKMIDNNSTYSYLDLWKISFNKKKINRKIQHEESTPYIYEHFGFNNSVLEKRIKENGFIIKKKIFFPSNILRIFSSHILYVVSKKI